jgi:hypothetical protein
VSPEEAAIALREEIEAALAEAPAPRGRLRSVEPPADLGADTCFRITLEARGAGLVVELPTGLAMAYLADEEAAVDEFKKWLADLSG